MTTGRGMTTAGLGRRAVLVRAAALALAAGGLSAAGLTACRKSGTGDGPVAIGSTDTCAHCGMEISDLRHAAEIVGADEVWKFDDTGELFAFHRKRRLDERSVKSMFVHDYHSKKWVEAESASYVVSDQITTPMNTGVVAFTDATAAREFAASQSGTVHSFAQLLAGLPASQPDGEHPKGEHP